MNLRLQVAYTTLAHDYIFYLSFALLESVQEMPCNSRTILTKGYAHSIIKCMVISATLIMRLLLLQGLRARFRRSYSIVFVYYVTSLLTIITYTHDVEL